MERRMEIPDPKPREVDREHAVTPWNSFPLGAIEKRTEKWWRPEVDE